LYGDERLWRTIYQANQSLILKGLLEPGQRLLVPQKP
jgi:nucleoid-associated protein YgaU